jgi:hypothetical protein
MGNDAARTLHTYGGVVVVTETTSPTQSMELYSLGYRIITEGTRRRQNFLY